MGGNLNLILIGLIPFVGYLGQSVQKTLGIASTRIAYRKIQIAFCSAIFILKLSRICGLEVINVSLRNKVNRAN